MKMSAKLAELRNLQNRADTLRKELGISRPGEVTFVASRNGVSDDIVVVETDGFGGATTSVVEGNYPVDYVTKFERSFSNEREAEEAAEDIAFNGISLTAILEESR
ncbi:MAG: hypothetical protein ACRD3T_16220 [Terriglobia bacterium]